MGATKTTAPSATVDKFQNTNSFVESFRGGIELEKSRLKKCQKNQTNSNSSRYLNPKGFGKKEKENKDKLNG